MTPPPPDLSGDESAFIEAATNGNAEAVGNLLAKGIPVDIRSYAKHVLAPARNVTALMLAAAGGHLETVKLLLKAGADVSAMSEAPKIEGSGSQALHEAVRKGHLAVVEALLDAGADPNVVGNRGSTPLTIAVVRLDLDCVKLLLKRGADPKIKPRRKDYSAPLCVAAGVARDERHLAKSGTEIVVIPEKKAVILELFDLLLANGADSNGQDGCQATALHTLGGGAVPALNLLRIPLIEKLLEAGAQPDASNENGTTPLKMAVLYINAEVTRILCKAGANVNRMTKVGTLLDIAEGKIKSCKASLEDEKLPSFFRDDAARRLPMVEETVKVLLEYGAKRGSELPPPAPEVPLKPAKKTTKDVKGAAHFLEFIRDGESEWALLAVKAPFEQVADAFTKHSRAQKRHNEVAIQVPKEPEEVARMGAVVQVKDNPWTVVYWSVYFAGVTEIEGSIEAAKALSAQLLTQAVAFVGEEDTSDFISYEFFEGGKTIAKPELGPDDDELIDKFFCKQGIYLPACYPAAKGKRSRLMVDKSSKGTVERADLVDW